MLWLILLACNGSDDSTGTETKQVLLREQTIDSDGNVSVALMSGRHTLRHKSGKNAIEVYYDVVVLGAEG